MIILQETVWQSNCHNIGSVNITVFLVGTSVTKKKSGNSTATLTELSSANDRGSECLLERVSETAAAGTGARLRFCCLIPRVCKLVAGITLKEFAYTNWKRLVTGEKSKAALWRQTKPPSIQNKLKQNKIELKLSHFLLKWNEINENKANAAIWCSSWDCWLIFFFFTYAAKPSYCLKWSDIG